MLRYLLPLLLLCCSFAHAVEPRSEHTYRLVEGESAPTATLADVAWLAGRWSCTAFGSDCEESWNPPSGGSMTGTFKLYDAEGVAFYEFMLLTHVEGVLTLRVKHFQPDMTAWEDRTETVDFPLVRLDEEAVHFDGLSFYRRDADSMDAYLLMRDENGDVREERLQYRRQP